MCVILVQPSGTDPFPDDWLRQGFENNPDGAGYMYSADNQLWFVKPLHSAEKLVQRYQADHAKYGAISAFAIHCRISTHGDDSRSNIHPHCPAAGVGLMHNGVLCPEFTPPFDSTQSDTAWFCSTVLAHRPPEFLLGRKCRKWLGEIIGARNKMVLMDAQGKFSIVNQDQWIRHGPYWASNTSYFTARPDPSIIAPPQPTAPSEILPAAYLEKADLDMFTEKLWKEAYDAQHYEEYEGYDEYRPLKRSLKNGRALAKAKIAEYIEEHRTGDPVLDKEFAPILISDATNVAAS